MSPQENIVSNQTKEKLFTGSEEKDIKNVDQTQGGMTEAAYNKKVGETQAQVAQIQEEKVPQAKQSFFGKLKGAFEKLTAVSPEKQIAKLKERLAEDIKDLTHIKTMDSGLGGGLGNFGGGSFWTGLSKSYGIPEDKIKAITDALKQYDDLPQGDAKVAFLKELNTKKFEITALMRKNNEDAIRAIEQTQE